MGRAPFRSGNNAQKTMFGRIIPLQWGSVVKRTLLAGAFSLLAADASAISRYSAGNMSCSEVQAVIRKDGAAIIQHRSRTGAVPLYGRYVSGREFCGYDEIVETSYVTSADDLTCPVQACVENEYVPERNQ
jgi:hypothetical protein